MGAAAAVLQGGVAIAAPPREPLASDVRMPRLALVHGRDDDSVTRIIAACAGDDGALLSRVFPVVYEELRRIAHRALLRARGSATLSTTALVNETYLKLAGHADLDLEGRKHLFALCARAMRQIVVDHARRRHADKRGGEPAWSLDTLDADSADRPETVVALDEALTALAERDPRLVRLIEYRVFGGLDSAGIAELLGLSPRSVQREWLRARAWVGRALDVRGDAESAA
jgi:RNA polymerase sigma factor (TIGR02999 family)